MYNKIGDFYYTFLTMHQLLCQLGTFLTRRQKLGFVHGQQYLVSPHRDKLVTEEEHHRANEEVSPQRGLHQPP